MNPWAALGWGLVVSLTLLVAFSIPLLVELSVHLGSLLDARRKRLTCVHDWKVIDKHVEPSNAAELFKLAAEADKECRVRNLYGTYICIVSCSKCGAIDKTVERV